MNLSVLDRLGSVSCCGKRLHQGQGDACVVRVVGGQLAPPIGRVCHASLGPRLLGQTSQHLCVSPSQPGALAVDPLLQLGRVLEVDPIHERTGIEVGGLLQLARAHRLLELQNVHRCESRPKLQVFADRHHRVFAQRLLDDVERVGERVTSPLRVVLGPEIGEQLVAAHPASGRKGQLGQQGQTPALSHGAAQEPLGSLEKSAAEELEGGRHLQARSGDKRAGIACEACL